MSEEQDQRLINIFANEALRKDEELAELKVEIAKLRELAKNYVCPELYEISIATSEALRKDRERLDWLLRECEIMQLDGNGATFGQDLMDRHDIDAAMKGTI